MSFVSFLIIKQKEFLRISSGIEPSLALIRAIRSHISQLLQQVPNNSEHYVMLKWADEQGEGSKATVNDFIEGLVRHHADHREEICETLRVHGR